MLKKLKLFLVKMFVKDLVKEAADTDLKPYWKMAKDAAGNIDQNEKVRPYVQKLQTLYHGFSPETQKEVDEAVDAIALEVMDKLRDKLVEKVAAKLEA